MCFPELENQVIPLGSGFLCEKLDMEGLKPGHKKRILPSWMTTQAAEKRAVPVKTPRRRMATGLVAATAASEENVGGSELSPDRQAPLSQGGVHPRLNAQIVRSASAMLSDAVVQNVRLFIGNKIGNRKWARPPTVETVYCMNEAEMVDVALGVLIEVQKQEESRKQLSLAGTKKPRLSPPCSMSPHTSSGDEEEDSEKDAPSPGLGPSQGPGGSDSAHNTSPKEEEDVLKYVREIFFS